MQSAKFPSDLNGCTVRIPFELPDGLKLVLVDKFAAVADAGQSAGLLQGELNHGAGLAGGGPAHAGGGDHVLVAAFDEGESRGHLVCPSHEFAVSDLAGNLERGLSGGLGRFALAQVVMHAPQERGQPSRDDQEFSVLVECDPT
ncbi:hypothetical protein ACQP25_33670 [Microtetraspora malaysiensis]|uniref:hypothetical protein n=1 Tax=Microtetraspora malaysiensis TaxID=161358 RepID=UPI003D8F426C